MTGQLASAGLGLRVLARAQPPVQVADFRYA